MFKPSEDDGAHDFQELQRELDRVKSTVFRRPDAAFFGPLMCSLDFIWSEQIDTAGTDGERFFWNPSFFKMAPGRFNEVRFNEFVLMHELWHVARLHMIRIGDRCPDYWNQACDIRLNNDLKQAGYMWGSFPAWFRPDFDLGVPGGVMTEEDIYDRIFQNPPGGGGGASPPSNPWGNGDMIEDPSGASKQGAVNNVVKAIQSAKISGQPGAIPGMIEQVVDRFLSPVIPWEQHLNQWMTDLQDEDFTWARPSRRHMASDMYLPSRYEDEGRLEHLMYFQDVSGSITDRDIMRFNSELKHVWDTFKPKRMTIAQFDTRITKVDEFEEGDPYERIKIFGRGGTCLVPVRQMIVDEEPTAAIIFSDMEVEPMEKLPFEVPILWVGVNARHVTVPFGKIIHIKE